MHCIQHRYINFICPGIAESICHSYSVFIRFVVYVLQLACAYGGLNSLHLTAHNGIYQRGLSCTHVANHKNGIFFLLLEQLVITIQSFYLVVRKFLRIQKEIMDFS